MFIFKFQIFFCLFQAQMSFFITSDIFKDSLDMSRSTSLYTWDNWLYTAILNLSTSCKFRLKLLSFISMCLIAHSTSIENYNLSVFHFQNHCHQGHPDCLQYWHQLYTFEILLKSSLKLNSSISPTSNSCHCYNKSLVEKRNKD